MLHGPGIGISGEMVPDVGKQPVLLEQAAAAGKLLGQRLKAGNDRQKTTMAMQAKLMAMFGEAV
jgi:hypothetical protein